MLHKIWNNLRNYWSTFWEGAITLMQVFEWFHHFKDGHTSVEGEECARHTSSSRNVQVIVEVHNFMRSEILQLMMGRLDQIFGHDMCQQSIWQLLKLKQSEHHLFVVSDLNHLGRSRQEFLWKHCPWRIGGITFWPWNWTPSLQWKTSPSLWLKTACRYQCKTKMSLITFFSQEGIIHHEFILQAWSISRHYYSEPLRHLCDAVCYKQTRKWHWWMENLLWQHSGVLSPTFVVFFNRNSTCQGFVDPHTPQTWPHATFSSFSKLRTPSRR
jgi:hypothetical protein